MEADQLSPVNYVTGLIACTIPRKSILSKITYTCQKRGLNQEKIKTDLSIGITDNYLSYKKESINELALIINGYRIAAYENWDPEKFAIGSTTGTKLTNCEIADIMNFNIIKAFYRIAKHELAKPKERH